MNPLLELIEHGQSFWIDNLTRTMIRGGDLKRRVDEEGLRGVTSNPAIFSKAMSEGEAYDEQIRELVAAGLSVSEIYEELVVTDIQGACDVLRPVYDSSDGADGFVSLEVSPYLAHDTEATLEEARRLFQAVDRPNVLIKIPGTPAGTPAIEQALYEGLNVNITLLFSNDAYQAVAEAYVRALERRLDEGKPVDRVASVASFFLSRIDVLSDELLNHRIRPRVTSSEGPRPELLLGKVAVANAKLAYERFKGIFAGDRWQRLADAGARVQQVLWASTSTKNPLYSDVKYVEPLIGPHTVNTMPDRTIAAFADHGVVADTVEEGVEEARRILADLAEVGIDLDRVTDQLIEEGIRKFVDPYDKLMGVLARERARYLGDHAVRQEVAVGPASSTIASALEGLDEQQLPRRLHARDPFLWKSDPQHQEVIRNRLGWLDTPTSLADRVEDLTAFAEEIRSEGFGHVVHLGMGGSSLCPEVCRQIFGSAKGWPELIVLDDTDPAAVSNVEDRVDLTRTLFIVASKSGTTTETLSFFHYFWEQVREGGVGDPGSRFVAITDPGTPLVAEARERGFRRVFENPEDIGGRYSALSYFGLVPMALLGMEVATILESARRMLASSGPEIPAAHSPGVELGAVLGVLGRAGRDKVTFLPSASLAPFGMWVEQLIAESTGKEGRGLLPVAGERPGSTKAYGDDRLFVHLRLAEDSHTEDPDYRFRALARAGHPVVHIELAHKVGLGAEFLHWELATAVAGSILGVDAFDQPNVAESKKNTKELLEKWQQDGSFGEGEPTISGSGLAVYAPGPPPSGRAARGVKAYLKSFLGAVGPGDYVALLAYFRATPERDRKLDQTRTRLRNRLEVATTLGYGPRYLHSTGQLHKGGPNTGVFVLLTADPGGDLEVPDKPYGFATLHRAQALGDYRSLVDHGRRVVRIHLGKDVEAGLGALASVLR